MEVTMKNVLFNVLVFMLFGLGSSYAQQQVFDAPPRDGVYDKINVQNHKSVPYVDVREADVMWEKRIWRVIDLKEKINHPLYYPEKPHNNWRSLITILLDALKEGAITAYDAPIGGTDEFLQPLTYQQIEQNLNRQDTQQLTRTEPPYDTYDTVIAITFNPMDIKQFKLKEDWFIDKQRSVLDVRIVGLCPMVASKDEKGEDRGVKAICWFYFPELRNILAHQEVYNRYNDAARFSFDDLFWKRMFGSYVIKESNVYDRSINEYLLGMDALLEAEKIKDNIFKFEHDLWEY